MKSIFEDMGGTYRREGDYLIPNLEPPDTDQYQIGKYGMMRKSYLKEHRSVLYNTMILNGTLYRHLAEVDQTCKGNCNFRKNHYGNVREKGRKRDETGRG